LVQEGYITRTPRGREVTELAYKHLGKSIWKKGGGLFDD
jgi:Holliday junction DNA helicase RuvB